MKRSKLVLAALAVGAMAMSAAPVLAASIVSPAFNVKAAVNAKCSIKTGPAEYDFGTYDPLATTNHDVGSGSAVLKCTKGSNVTVTISNPAMSNGTDSLTYSWFREAGRTTAFGSYNYTSTSSADETINFFGRIAALQDVGTGNYSNNTATMTVAY